MPGLSPLDRQVNSKREPVKLKFSSPGSVRLREITSTPPQPGGVGVVRQPTPQHEQAGPITPTTTILPPATSPNFFARSSLLQSPSSTNYFATSPGQAQPGLNLGGFRSYGPVPEATVLGPAEVKQERLDATAGSPPAPVEPLLPSAPLTSPLADGNHGMRPPPKKNLTIKLGARKPSEGGSAGSPH